MYILTVSLKLGRRKEIFKEKTTPRIEMLKFARQHTHKHASVSVAPECEWLPVTVGAISGAGCLPPGFKPPHHPPQQGTRRTVYLTYSKTASIVLPHPRLTNDGQGSTHHCHICPSNCPPPALHPSQSSPKPTHCLSMWTSPHFYLNHIPPKSPLM